MNQFAIVILRAPSLPAFACSGFSSPVYDFVRSVSFILELVAYFFDFVNGTDVDIHFAACGLLQPSP